MHTPKPNSGTLWVVATPIGNLDDMSTRAKAILARVDVIAAEDTRTSRKLLPPRERPPEWVALHEHNEAGAVARLIDALRDGSDVALVSDAGTPLVSDPGYRLVAAAHDHGLRVSPMPGPCAAIAALSAAGLPSDRFRFEGFLPPRKSARRTRLEPLKRISETLIFYVPARDLDSIIGEFASIFGETRRAVIARELTKQFETIRRGELDELGAWVASDPDQLRGEAVVLVEGWQRPPDAGRTPSDEVPLTAEQLAHALAGELAPARAARTIARLTGLDRKAAFALVESMRDANR